MKFSVIIPIYNAEKTLHISVDSIIEQTYSDWELILVNDGSRDSSLSICQKYASADSRIVVIDQDNSGAGATRNRGIKEAKGDYLVFCDADDFYEKTALEIFAKAIEETSADLVICSYNEYKLIDEKKTIIRSKSIEPLFLDDAYEIKRKYIELYKQSLITAPWCKAYKRKVIIENNVQFADLRRCEDNIFNLNCYEYINSLAVVSDAVYNYQTPEASIYLKKFPVDMFDINKEVYTSIKNKLDKWAVLDSEAISYFDSRFVRDTAIILRLNYQNNWNLSRKNRSIMAKKILNDQYLNKAEKSNIYEKTNRYIALILKTKRVFFVNTFCWLTIIYQKVFER